MVNCPKTPILAFPLRKGEGIKLLHLKKGEGFRPLPPKKGEGIRPLPLKNGEGIKLLPLKKGEIKRGWSRIHQVRIDKVPSGEPVDFTLSVRCDIPRGEFSGEEDGSNGN